MISLTDAGGGKEAATGVTVGGEDTTLQGGGQVPHVMVNTFYNCTCSLQAGGGVVVVLVMDKLESWKI